MATNLIESLLYDGPERFDTLLNNQFNEHIHFTHLDPVYVVNFLLGLSSILMSDDIRSKYGIRRLFFTNFGPDKVVRLTILNEKKSPDDTSTLKRMKVRTFDINSKRWVGKRILLSSEENNVMRLLLSGEVDGLTREFTKSVEDLYKNDPNLEKINMDEYPTDYAVYAVGQEEIHKVDKEDIRTRTRVNFYECVSDQQLRKRFAEHHIGDISYLLSPQESADFAKSDNTIILLTDKKIITPKIQRDFDPNAVSDFYKQYYEYSGLGLTSLEKFRKVLTGHDGVSGIFRSISPSEGISAECGFTHGALFLLSYSHPTYIEVRQKISSALYSPGSDKIVDPSTEMSIICKPKLMGRDRSLYQIPIIVYFPKHYSNPNKAVGEVPIAMSLNGRVGAVAMKFRDGFVQSSFSTIEKRVDIVDHLFYFIGKQMYPPDRIASMIERQMERIRPSLREYKLSDRNYLSRYFAGWIASSESRQVSYQLFSKDGNSESTKFLIKSAEENIYERSGSIPKNILFIIREEKMTKMHIPETDALDESYIQYMRKNDEDTMIVNIEQEYVHAECDFVSKNYDQDFTRFKISISYAKVEKILQSHGVVELGKISVQSILDNLANRKSTVAEKHLSSLFKSTAHILATENDFKAFLDGIFMTTGCLRSETEAKSVHSDVYYIFDLGRGRLSRVNFKSLFKHLTKDELVEISRSAYEELQSSRWLHYGQFFQFIFSKTAGTSNVKLLGKEQLSLCAMPRLRRSFLNSCHAGLDDDEVTEELNDKILFEHQISNEATTPRAFESLRKISMIAGYMMHGFMVRDLVSDVVNRQYGAMAKDIGFLLASVSSPILGRLAKVSGEALLGSESKFSGYTLKTIGIGLERAISLYVFADFVENAVAYARDTNDTEAQISMSVDGAFLAIDVLTIAAQSFGVMAFVGPVGEIACVLLVVGLNIYQTVKRVKQIELIIPLNADEVIDETFRAFFHINIEQHVQELITEKMANYRLMEKAVDYLNQQSRVDTFITESAAFTDEGIRLHDDNIIDMRLSLRQRISRASPGIVSSENLLGMQMACYLHEEKIEIEHKPSLWKKFVGFFYRIYKTIRPIDQVREGEYWDASKVTSECDGNCITMITPTCQNSFGISKNNTSQENAALFKLNNGSDHVYGYSEKPNIFLMTNGVKNITAGNKNDTFILIGGLITGMLDGSNGVDVLDLSSLKIDYLKIKRDILKIKIGSSRSFLHAKNFETIILPKKNNIKERANIFIGSNIRNIVSHGKTSIIIPDDFDNELVSQSSGWTKIKNYARTGDFVYVIGRNQQNKTKRSSLKIVGNSTANHKIILMENLWNIQNQTYNNGTFCFETTEGLIFRLVVPLEIIKNTRIIFNDGSIITSSDNHIISVTLSTNFTIQKIERMYTDALERIGILMVAYSFADDESITISHGKVEKSRSLISTHILHNSVDHSTHMRLNGGQYLLLINTNHQGKIQNTTIKSTHARNLTELVIDLNGVIEHYFGDNSSFINVGAHLQSQSGDLNIQIRLQKRDTTAVLGSILVQNILSDKFYEKISIRNYGKLRCRRQEDFFDSVSSVEKHTYPFVSDTNMNFLIPLAINFGNSTDVVVLTPHNVEPLNEVIINLNISRYDYYKINESTLVLTNVHYNFENDYEDLLTIFIESFFTIEKMKTLQIMIDGALVELQEDVNDTLTAPDISLLLVDKVQ